MKKVDTVFQNLIRSLNNTEELNTFGPVEKTLMICFETLKPDYFTFILGFLSAVVIEAILGFFDTIIADGVFSFIVSCLNIVIFCVITYDFLRFSVEYPEIYSAIHSKPTLVAGYNSIMSDFSVFKNKIIKLSRYLKVTFLLFLLGLLINIVHMIYINCV